MARKTYKRPTDRKARRKIAFILEILYMRYSKASTYKLLEVILTILLDPMYITKITCITISMKN